MSGFKDSGHNPGSALAGSLALLILITPPQPGAGAGAQSHPGLSGAPGGKGPRRDGGGFHPGAQAPGLVQAACHCLAQGRAGEMVVGAHRLRGGAGDGGAPQQKAHGRPLGPPPAPRHAYFLFISHPRLRKYEPWRIAASLKQFFPGGYGEHFEKVSPSPP